MRVSRSGNSVQPGGALIANTAAGRWVGCLLLSKCVIVKMPPW
jgi:hypothetical protein